MVEISDNKAEEGRQAYRSGLTREQNPYAQGSSRYWQWSSGWLDEQAFRPSAALASAEANAGEPVAWRRPSVGARGLGIYDIENTTVKPVGDGWEPLYTSHPAPQTGGPVKVKPLEWKFCYNYWGANTLFDRYYEIKCWGPEVGIDGPRRPYSLYLYGVGSIGGPYATKEEAMAAAQADYERRIMSVIDSQEIQQDGKPMKVSYRNWKGEISERTITPICVWYGVNKWHPELQWFLTAYDHDKKAERDFALKDFGAKRKD